MLEINELKQLVKAAVNANPSAPVAYSFGEEKFSYADVNETLRAEFNALAGDINSYRKNKNLVFELMEVAIDDYLPKKVLEQYGQFAEVRQFAQGDKAVFVQRITEASRRRAKQFVTKVGLAGVYEVFKLDGRSLEVPVTAYGGAAQIAIEEFLDGRVDFADLTQIVMEGLDEAVYKEIAKSLMAAIDSLQPANVGSADGFDETEMDRLLQVADTYGHSTIYCTYEFAAAMLPADKWVSDNMRDTRWAQGHLGNYKGHNVIILEQSFEDETNTVKVIPCQYAWIIPGGAEKPVKVAFEGQALTKEVDNHDWSKEFRIYKKFGVATMITNNICVYTNEALAPVEEDEPGEDVQP